MSKARSNCSASIQRKWLACSLPRAKLQKSQPALQELVTAILQRAGPPRRTSRTISHVFASAGFMAAMTPRLEPGAAVADSRKLDAQRPIKDAGRRPSTTLARFNCRAASEE